MSGTLTDIILLVIILILLAVMILIIMFYSDRSQNYKLVSVILFIPGIILEFPHMLLPDPTNLIDITVHITTGLAIFLFVTHLRFIRIENRHWWAFLLCILSIIVIEILLSLLEIFMGYVNPIGIDSLEDILWNTFGGMIGLVIHYEYATKTLMNEYHALEERCEVS